MSTKAALLRPSRPPAYERTMTDACPPADLHQSLSADVAGHRLELLFDGGDRLTRLLDLINGAATSAALHMYIFEGAASGRPVLVAFLPAAEGGCCLPGARRATGRET